MQEHPEKRKAQTKLADDVTLLIHGESGLQSARRATEAIYTDNIEALSILTAKEMHEVFKSNQTSTVGSADLTLSSGTTILDMAIKAGCFKNQSM